MTKMTKRCIKLAFKNYIETKLTDNLAAERKYFAFIRLTMDRIIIMALLTGELELILNSCMDSLLSCNKKPLFSSSECFMNFIF